MLDILCCAKLLLDPNYKISCLNVASFLGRMASENLECYPKIRMNIFFVKKVFKVCDRGGTCSLIKKKLKLI